MPRAWEQQPAEAGGDEGFPTFALPEKQGSGIMKLLVRGAISVAIACMTVYLAFPHVSQMYPAGARSLSVEFVYFSNAWRIKLPDALASAYAAGECVTNIQITPAWNVAFSTYREATPIPGPGGWERTSSGAPGWGTALLEFLFLAISAFILLSYRSRSRDRREAGPPDSFKEKHSVLKIS